MPQAFLGGTDEVSFRILSALSEAGIAVPKDLSRVSIDNIEMSEFANPPLTTVNADTWDMGRTAVQILMRRTARTAPPPPSTTLLPTTLVIRKSCI